MSQSTNDTSQQEAPQPENTMNQGIHSIQSELTIVTVDEWLDDEEDAEVVQLKEQLDAQIIAKSNQQFKSRDNPSYRGDNRYRDDGGRGRERGRGRNRDRWRGRERGRRNGSNSYETRSYQSNQTRNDSNRNQNYNSYSRQSYNTTENYNSQNRYNNNSYSTQNNRYNNDNNRYKNDNNRYKNDPYSSQDNRYKNDNTYANNYNNNKNDNTHANNYNNNKHSKNKQYDSNQYNQSSYNKYQPNHDQNTSYNNTQQTYYDNKNSNDADTYNTASQNTQQSAGDIQLQSDAKQDPTPSPPDDYTLNNMRHTAYFNSDIDLTLETLHALVNEAIIEPFFEPLIQHLKKYISVDKEQIAQYISGVFDKEFEKEKLRQFIIDDEFGDKIYTIMDRYYHEHKGDQSQNQTQIRSVIESAIEFAQEEGTEGAAYVSYCLPRDDSFILCSSVLALSLKNAGCKHKRVLLLPADSFDKNGELLKYYQIFGELWDECIPFQHNDSVQYHYLKIHCLGLIQYSKIMFIEPYCVTDDVNLETFFDECQAPSAPDNNAYGQQYDVMVITPNKNQYLKLFDAVYNAKEALDDKTISDKIANLLEWSTIENESDKDEFLFNVTQTDVQENEAEETSVLAFFKDAKPWTLYKLKVNDTQSCVALYVWMETAKKLVKEYKSLAIVVNPDILKIIDPEFGATNQVEDNKKKQLEEKDDDNDNDGNDDDDDDNDDDDDSDLSSSDSESMPTPPPNYYVTRRDPQQVAKDDEKETVTKGGDESDGESDESDSDQEENNALKARDVDEEDID